jgi:hypothetical protein
MLAIFDDGSRGVDIDGRDVELAAVCVIYRAGHAAVLSQVDRSSYSEIAPSEQDIRDHARQLSDYLDATGASRGALVYVTSGFIQWGFGEPTWKSDRR